MIQVLFLFQQFDVQLIAVTSGTGTLGSDRSVRVGILKNDSPTGLFSFAVPGVSTSFNKTLPAQEAMYIFRSCLLCFHIIVENDKIT